MATLQLVRFDWIVFFNFVPIPRSNNGVHCLCVCVFFFQYLNLIVILLIRDFDLEFT